MTLQFVLELEFIACSSIELNASVSSDSQRLSVSREGVVGDGVVEEVVDFWARHFEEYC